ncbi:spermidine synthase [Actinomadura sp. 6N118]|uniref:spermidine synthase n=1 Tax=Actinomadura sp. 6N118 TaxID=3375151 RepID=UPI0037C12C70
MSARFEELDWRPTPMGVISLRRRRDPSLGTDVFEIKLDDEFLMSSMWTAGEIALAEFGLAQVPGDHLDVAVGGLGLGHTAQAVLAHSRVRSLVVVEALAEVIEWHQRRLLPLGEQLTSDPRCHLVQGDFFALAGTASGLDPQQARRFDAILVDIDHSPRHTLNPTHASFYRPDGLSRLAKHLHPGGVFGLWSNDPPDDDFHAALTKVFTETASHVVTFPNPVQGGESANTVYIARTPSLPM